MHSVETTPICACHLLFVIVAILSWLKISWHKYTSVNRNLESIPKYVPSREIVVRSFMGEQLWRSELHSD